MNLTLSANIRTELSEGFILLDRGGQPREANPAAQPWLRRCVQLTAQWARNAALEQAGSLQLPTTVDIDSNGDETPPAHIQMLKNGNNGYALLIHCRPASLPNHPNSRKSGFHRLLGGQVRVEIANFNRLVDECRDAVAQSAELARQADRLHSLLVQVGDLVELDQRDEVFADERLALDDIVRAILPQLPRAGGDENIRYTLTHTGEKLGAVYGNKKWLGQALRTLLGRLGRDCPARGSVVIDLRQIGDYLVLNGRSSSDSAGWHSVPVVAGDALVAGQLRSEICHRIIELHGGQLKIRFIDGVASPREQDENAPVESLTLTLPTGVPLGDRSRVSCAECRITLQAMQYARDLAEMTAGGVATNNTAKES